jgi:leucyl aminopeptidase
MYNSNYLLRSEENLNPEENTYTSTLLIRTYYVCTYLITYSGKAHEMARRIISARCYSQAIQLFLLSRSTAFQPYNPFLGVANANTQIKRPFTSTTSLFASSATLTFHSSLDSTFADEKVSFNATMVIGLKPSLDSVMPNLLETLGLDIVDPVKTAMMDAINEKTGGTSNTIIAVDNNTYAHKVSFCGLPTKVSRNNHPMSVHTLTKYAGHALSKGNTRIIVVADTPIAPLASALAKAYPEFSMKSSKNNGADKATASSRNVHVAFMRSDGTIVDTEDELKAADAVSQGVKLAARLVDTHPELLTTTQFAKEVEKIVHEHPSIKMTQLIGNELKAYGGLFAVGRQASCPPRLIILEYDGGGDESVALVGKGIVYDTGGLSLKTRAGMSGMKHDMAGAAGMLGGFYSAVKLGVKKKVYLLLCLAENAIGPNSFRNDDILQMYSGKFVEVNNCDAEGRLVLGDGVAHATKHFEHLDLVVTMATLTGAQLIATGKKHAGILANTEELERRGKFYVNFIPLYPIMLFPDETHLHTIHPQPSKLASILVI